MKAIKLFLAGELEIPPHKIAYAIHAGLIKGLFDRAIKRFPSCSPVAVWDELYEVLSDKLSGTPGIEHEWEGDEYDKLISFRPYPLGDTVNVPLAAS